MNNKTIFEITPDDLIGTWEAKNCIFRVTNKIIGHLFLNQKEYSGRITINYIDQSSRGNNFLELYIGDTLCYIDHIYEDGFDLFIPIEQRTLSLYKK